MSAIPMRPDVIDWKDKVAHVSLQALPRRTMQGTVWRWITFIIVMQTGIGLLVLGALQSSWRTQYRIDHADAMIQLAAGEFNSLGASQSPGSVQTSLNRVTSNPAVSFAAIVDDRGRVAHIGAANESAWTKYRSTIATSRSDDGVREPNVVIDSALGLLVVETSISTPTSANGHRLVLGLRDVASQRALLDGVTAISAGTVCVTLLLLPLVHHRLRRWTTGMQRLHVAIRRMSQWSDPKPLAVGGSDEVAYLSVAFNDMAGKVLHGRQALVDANEQLERRVSMRTQELHLANSDLAQKNSLLAQVTETALRFTDDVAHEFRTPLTVIGEFASIIADGLGGDVTAKQTEYLTFITDASRDLANLVDDFLDSSKLRAGSLRVDRQPHQVQDIFDSVWPLLESRARANGLALERTFGVDVPRVFADLDKARRTLINLVVNAIKFSKAGGLVRVHVERDKSGGVVIRVTDQGPGMSTEEVKTLFARFHQGREGNQSACKGFGLGLSIVRELVALNLGSVAVESTVGVGSTFSFTLPSDSDDVIVASYLDRIAERSSSSIVSVLRACRERPPHDNEQLQSFLSSMLRPTDLQLRAADGCSVCLIGEHANDDEWRALMLKSDEDYRHHSINAGVPPLAVEKIAVASADDVRESILAALTSNTREHAPCPSQS